MRYISIVLGLAACGDNQAASPDAPATTDSALAVDASIDAPPTSADACTTSITATSGEYVEICAVPSGAAVRHVRIAGVLAPATHASAQLWFGFESAPAAPTGPLAADQFKVLLYGGGAPGVPAMVQAVFGTREQTLTGNTAFVNASSTVCFDLHDGSATTAPAFVLWVDGQNGADCETRSTLTIASAFGVRARWRGPGTVDKQAKLFFRQSPGVTATPQVTVSSEPVLAEAAIISATACTTTFTATTDWQQLCAPPAGAAKHVVLDTVASATNNSYWYAVIGQDAAPTGSPAASPGKLIVTGGRSNSGASWTWFRFDDGTTTQFTYANAAGELYTTAASTVCFDLGATMTGNARLVFWATGANGADCATRATLTLANALYDSTTDATTGAIWDAPHAAGKLNFVKVNNANVTLANVAITAEPTAL